MKDIEKYSKLQVILHWVMALIVGYCMFSALIKGYLPKPDKAIVMDYHKWLGILVLMLLSIRIVVRFSTKQPDLNSGNPIQDKLAHFAHILLYFFMFIVPLAGILMMQYGGYNLSFFGLPIPQFTNVDKTFSKYIKEFHEVLGFIFIGLVGLHLLAALKHHLIDKDGLLNRMKL